MREVIGNGLRKTALLCALTGAHLLLLWNLDLGGVRGSRVAQEAPGILYFVSIPDPAEPAAVSLPPSRRQRSTVDPGLEVEAARDDAISLPSENEGLIDWAAESSRIAGEVAERDRAKEQYRPLDRPPPGMGPPPPGPTRHKFGDTQRFEGGEIITWIDERCYYSNGGYISPYGANSPFADTHVQRPICKGAPSRDLLKEFKEWKKER